MNATLHLVDANGELVHEDARSYDEALLIIDRLEAELRGYRLRVGNLQRELRELQPVEPVAQDVRCVGEYWARRVHEEGWWSRLPSVRPGSKRWSGIRGRLMDPEARWTPPMLCETVEGALMQKQMKRAWLDAASIFRNEENCSRHYEHAHDPKQERVRALRELPEELQRIDLKRLCGRCDCGHLRIEHSQADPQRYGQEPCLTCDCQDYDDLNYRADQWLARQRRRAA